MTSLLLALVAGVGVGLVLGTMGSGGSILTIPVLIGLLGMGASEATTTALLVVMIAAAVGTFDRIRRGHVRMRTAVVFSLAGIPGSIAGTALNRAIDEGLLVQLLACLVLVVAAVTWRRAGTVARDPGRPRRTSWTACIPTALAGLAIGVLTGLFGVGGGFLIVPVLVITLRLPIHEAVGTSLMVITLVSGIAFTSHMIAGATVDWSVALPFTGSVVAGAAAGTLIGGRIPPIALARTFAVLLAAVGVALFATA